MLPCRIFREHYVSDFPKYCNNRRERHSRQQRHLFVGWRLATCWSTIGRQASDSRLTVCGGELFFTFTGSWVCKNVMCNRKSMLIMEITREQCRSAAIIYHSCSPFVFSSFNQGYCLTNSFTCRAHVGAVMLCWSCSVLYCKQCSR